MVMKSLLLRWSWNLASISTGGSPARILVVYDKQTAAAPAITDILVADTFIGQNNLNNRDRFPFSVIRSVNPLEQTATQYWWNDLQVFNMETMFNSGNAGTVADITSGSVYLFVAQTAGILVPIQSSTGGQSSIYRRLK